MKKEAGASSVHAGFGVRADEDMTGMAADLEMQHGSVLVMTADAIGHGDDQLGRVLIKSFFYTLSQADQVPATVIFLNSGVRLACQGSEIVTSLFALEGRGTEIISCGTCLDYFQLKDKIVVGKVSNMYTIVDTINRALKVVKL